MPRFIAPISARSVVHLTYCVGAQKNKNAARACSRRRGEGRKYDYNSTRAYTTRGKRDRLPGHGGRRAPVARPVGGAAMTSTAPPLLGRIFQDAGNTLTDTEEGTPAATNPRTRLPPVAASPSISRKPPGTAGVVIVAAGRCRRS